jgi:hypothetical protein
MINNDALDSYPRNSKQIEGLVINACFPRSGHRFLRNMVRDYFSSSMVFYEAHSKVIKSYGDREELIDNVNYAKTHDFKSEGREVLNGLNLHNRKYLIQIRHPLESIISWYEFSLKHKTLEVDNRDTWLNFLEQKFSFWKSFYNVWEVNSVTEDKLLVKYDDLYSNSQAIFSNVIEFLSGDKLVDSSLIKAIVNSQEFLQYVGDTSSVKNKKREVSEFKYFDLTLFTELEASIMELYLKPADIKSCL